MQDSFYQRYIYLTWMVNLSYWEMLGFILYVPVVWSSYDNMLKKYFHTYSCTIYIAGDGGGKGRGRICNLLSKKKWVPLHQKYLISTKSSSNPMQILKRPAQTSGAAVRGLILGWSLPRKKITVCFFNKGNVPRPSNSGKWKLIIP